MKPPILPRPGTIRAVGIGPDTRLVVVGVVPGAWQPPQGTMDAAQAQVQAALQQAGLTATVVQLAPGLLPHASTHEAIELARVGEELAAVLTRAEWAGPGGRCPSCGARKVDGHSRSYCRLERVLAYAAGVQLLVGR